MLRVRAEYPALEHILREKGHAAQRKPRPRYDQASCSAPLRWSRSARDGFARNHYCEAWSRVAAARQTPTSPSSRRRQTERASSLARLHKHLSPSIAATQWTTRFLTLIL